MGDFLHDFHFVVGRNMKEKIMSVDVLKDCTGLSMRIIKILNVLSPIIDRKHRWGKERMHYLPVSDNPDEIRDHVHVYMPGDFYRGLKLLHQDLNFYSIAQLLRVIIGWFLWFVDVCDGDIIKELEKTFLKWEAEEEQIRLTPFEKLRQLMSIIQHLPGKNRLITIYDWKFSPFWILRM